jgi:hypothetical protein
MKRLGLVLALFGALFVFSAPAFAEFPDGCPPSTKKADKKDSYSCPNGGAVVDGVYNGKDGKSDYKPLETQKVTFVTAKDCGKGNSFFGIPPWYKYLQFDAANNCDLQFKLDTNGDGKIDASDNSFKVVWLIALAVVEALLVLAGFVAVAFVIYGGFKFITSQGVPDKIAKARTTILNALVGVVIAILGSQIVAFIARSLT